MIDISKLKIVTFPHEALQIEAAPVQDFNDEIRAVINRMFNLMRQMNGIGLAAPQIGLPLQIFVTDIENDPCVYINPKLSSPFGGWVIDEEGCLSIPGMKYKISRHKVISISAKNEFGEEIKKIGGGLHSRCWQHECDHLRGVLIKDIAIGKPIKRLNYAH